MSTNLLRREINQHMLIDIVINTFDVHQVWTANADGSEPRLLLESNAVVYVFSGSPDGRYLLYTGEPTPTVCKGTTAPNTGGPF
jgi:hypothetical protein